jgi:predicted nucleic acid-binding protein
VNQDEAKQRLASSMIEKALTENTLFLSPLVFGEYVFALAKLRMLAISQIRVDFFADIIQDIPSAAATQKGYNLCRDLDFCRNINDATHLKTAEAHCDKLVTFDRDFKRFIPHTSLEIEILD